MNRCRTKLSLATTAALASLLAAALPAAGAADDPDATLRQALANLSASPRVTSSMSTVGSFKQTRRLIVNADKRFVFRRATENGRQTSRTLETSRVFYAYISKRRCWTKRRKQLNAGAYFKNMKRKISAAEQLAPDVIAYTHDEELGVFRVEMRYDPVTLLPIELNATYIDDGQGEPGVKSYRTTFSYTATNTVPRHRPACR